MISYTLLAGVVLIAVFVFGIAVLKTRLFSSVKFWIAYAPIEDLFFGFALVTLTIFIWERLGASTSTKP